MEKKLPRLLRRKEVLELIGISRSQLYRLERQGQFPSSRSLSKQMSRWLETEILDWMQDLPFRWRRRL